MVEECASEVASHGTGNTTDDDLETLVAEDDLEEGAADLNRETVDDVDDSTFSMETMRSVLEEILQTLDAEAMEGHETESGTLAEGERSPLAEVLQGLHAETTAVLVERAIEVCRLLLVLRRLISLILAGGIHFSFQWLGCTDLRRSSPTCPLSSRVLADVRLYRLRRLCPCSSSAKTQRQDVQRQPDDHGGGIAGGAAAIWSRVSSGEYADEKQGQDEARGGDGGGAR